jgi:two-component system response regulator AtoC
MGERRFSTRSAICLSRRTQLLRVMDRGECQPVGASRPGRVDVRFVGATNHDESFRNDFVARFVARVRVPPLRERREDIPLLIRHLLLQRARREPALERFLERRPDGRMWPRLSGRLVDHLVRQPLPANVRELEGFLVRAVNASTDGKDKVRLAPEDETSTPTRPPAAPAARVEREPRGQAAQGPGDPSREQVVACLERERGNVARAARGLGLQRNKLYRLMESYGIERPPVE